MAYYLDGTEIRRPTAIEERNNTQVAQQRTLDGSINRDHFGDNKRVWVLVYRNVKTTDHDTIRTIYNSYLATTTLQSWQITEPNYLVDSVLVHVDLQERGFTIRGTDYLSDFDLVLTEA